MGSSPAGATSSPHDLPRVFRGGAHDRSSQDAANRAIDDAIRGNVPSDTGSGCGTCPADEICGEKTGRCVLPPER